MHHTCVSLVLGSLVATDAVLARALELRGLARVTGEAIGFRMGSLEQPRVYQPVGVPRVCRMTNAAGLRANPCVRKVSCGLEFGQVAACTKARCVLCRRYLLTADTERRGCGDDESQSQQVRGQ